MVLPSGVPWTERLAGTWVCAVLGVTIVGFGFSAVGIPFAPHTVGPLLLCIAGLAWWKGPTSKAIAPPYPPWVNVGLLLLLGGMGLIVGRAALSTPIDMGDPLHMWALRAKNSFLSQGIRWEFLRQHEDLHTLHHPPMLPLLEAWVFLCRGHVDLLAVKLLFACSYVATIAAVAAYVVNPKRPGVGLGLTALAATTPVVMAYGTVAYADGILAGLVVFTLGNLVALLHGEKERTPAFLVGIWACAWAKNEGVVYVVAMVGTLLLLARGSLSLHRRLRTAVFGLAGLVPWMVVKGRYNLRSFELDSGRLTSERLLEAIQRVPLVLNFLVREIFFSLEWNFLGVLLLLFTIQLWRGRRDLYPPVLASGCIIPTTLFILGGVYLFVAVSPQLLMHASLERVLLPWGLLWLTWVGSVSKGHYETHRVRLAPPHPNDFPPRRGSPPRDPGSPGTSGDSKSH